MAKNYQWKTDAIIISGGYPQEETGIISGTTDWHTTDSPTGSTSDGYFYRDSSTAQNSNSSRVVVGITESWVASIDSKNNLTITLTTQIDNIVRDDIRGTPWISPYARYRNIYLRRESGGSILWSATNDDINNAHTILGSPVTLDSYTFTLAPGENLSRGSIYYFSTVPGHESDPLPNIYTDVMWLGTSFRNILPKDYRPGATLNTTNNIWFSNNKEGGACHVLKNGVWQECRTVGGDEGGQGNPPLMLRSPNANSWYNQRLLGKG